MIPTNTSKPYPAKFPNDSAIPTRVDRKRGAQLITDLFFPISHRTLETWPLVWRQVNGRATCETSDLLSLAQAKLDAAPPMMGGRKVSQSKGGVDDIHAT